ncbi:DNA-pol [Buzura suppressaria nucleopolyhedrovirus]|uniref:DNA-directed DNA polymerase n=2 Tax=Buzura suppressaria nuclear polyhedrosis virus TaxID=74320 RepID=W5VS65_NPVBS|nr:DNA-pol [Buzura suppressaria nucleopolyhedrovirus]AHH82647.1 DNA-pol [Buzura suppressaria nucleopolyhedrovirus]AKN91030.1 DNA-pol [Buzura suppressaria nucleopolyhedrovirus]
MANDLINLMKWDKLKSVLKSTINCVRSDHNDIIKIEQDDVFRITKMAYKDGYLIIFLTGYLKYQPDRLFQCYVETKCNLYSYRFCYNDHAFNKCRYNCKSYKAFVMPGLRNVHMDKFNVIRYQRTHQDNEKFAKKPLDYFMRDVNRVHMQTNLIEGQYVKFRQAQTCSSNCRVNCAGLTDPDMVNKMFYTVSMESLKREIVPVIVAYDIETHSNGQRFSNAQEDRIMSISIVMRRDNINTRLCFYHMQGADDLNQETTIAAFDVTKINTIRFDDEFDMLKAFFELLPLLNGDYLLDYNGDKFDMPYILDRIKVLTNATYCQQAKRARVCHEKFCMIARYNLDPVPIEKQDLHDKFNNKLSNHLLTYYVHVDLYQFLSADPEHKNLENFQLNTVAEHYLNQSKVDLSIAEMLNLYNNNCIRKIIEYNIQDSVLPIELFLKLEIMDFLYTQCMLLYLCTDDLLSNISHKINIVFFYLCITNTNTINGREISDPFIFNKNDLNITSGKRNTTFDNSNNRNSVNETRTGFVNLDLLKRQPVPIEKIPSEAVKLCTTRPICNYKGGKVLAPKTGLQKWVVTLDFNSLYLTIMMYEGACFSNLLIGSDNNVYLVKDSNAINPKLLATLLNLRTTYKNKRDIHEKNSFLYNLYDTLQNAVKRIANSIYGYFGIYFKILANYITKIGRKKLMEAIKKIEAMSQDDDIRAKFHLSNIEFRVIYGDTDSSFIQVLFKEDEIAADMRHEIIKKIVNDHVLKKLNDSWDGKGYKMALENVMSNLILLKKKKYCYLNSENRIKYKGWLIKKDMPIFMRKSFRAVVDSFLHNHSVACGMKLLMDNMSHYYQIFNTADCNLNDYSFSMSYNENSTSKKKNKIGEQAVERKPVITIARHCRELMLQAGVKNLPGNGDRIPFLLIDINASITKKAYPQALFVLNKKKISWLKHMNILCNFMNELIEIFGTHAAFEYYFTEICKLYMSEQMHDIKYPILKLLKNKAYNRKNLNSDKDSGNDDDDDDDENDSDEDCNSINDVPEFTNQFRMCVTKNKKMFNYKLINQCNKCNALC